MCSRPDSGCSAVDRPPDAPRRRATGAPVRNFSLAADVPLDREDNAMSNPALLHRGDHQWDDAFPLLPEQFAETSRALEIAEPERRLLLAVLCDAIVVFQRRVVGTAGSAIRPNEA